MDADRTVQLSCAGCAARFRVKNYAPSKAYKCSRCGAVLPLPDATAGGAKSSPPQPKLRLQGEPEHKVFEIPVRLGRYRILGELGRGGMGVVYLGSQEALDRKVAIKMLLGGWAQDPEALKRFQREARAAARLRHPNIVSIHEIGTYRDAPFFTMDFVEGKGLDKILTERPMAPREAARIIRDVARAMHYAHQHGVVHRDLKPGNVMIDKEGVPHVTDFGMAKDLFSESILSMTGDVMGTPGYMAPEQAEGRVHEIDHRADVYALGAILYRILVGKPPFEGPTAASTIYKIVNEFAIEPIKLNKNIPVEINAIVVKAIEKETGARYVSAGELAEDLDSFLHGRVVSVRPPRKGRLLWLRIKQHRLAVGLVAGSASVALIALAAFLLLPPDRIDMLRENLSSGNPEIERAALLGVLDDLAGRKGVGRGGMRSNAFGLVAEYAARHADVESRRAILKAFENDDFSHDLYRTLKPTLHKWLAEREPVDLCEYLVVVCTSEKDRDAMPGIIALLDHPDVRVKHAALDALEAMPDIRALDALTGLQSHPEVGERAAQILGRMFDPLQQFTSAAGGTPIGQQLSDLARARAEANRQLEDLMAEEDAAFDPVGTLAELAQGGPVERRLAAIQRLGKLAHPQAGAALFEVLRRGEPALASEAARALGPDRARRLEPELQETLFRGATPEAKVAAAEALALAGTDTGRGAIERALAQESDAAVASEFRRVLGR